jgi:hypothetical protein
LEFIRNAPRRYMLPFLLLAAKATLLGHKSVTETKYTSCISETSLTIIKITMKIRNKLILTMSDVSRGKQHFKCKTNQMKESARIGSLSLACWYTPVIPALRRVRQKDHEFEAGLAT